ncbi:hypothetical protein SAMN04487846_0819 [Microbacterium sp. cf046]|nr:hypothetical protein SAMN04487846_0819 [Microbacterium sp. cf046]
MTNQPDVQGDGDEREQADEMPTTEELAQPSTEKEPDEEPRGGASDAEPDHTAVGIGVIDAPLPDSDPGDA